MFPVKVETRILLNCPHCRFSSRYDTGFLEDAIHDGKEISCVACGGHFLLSVVAAEIAAEQSFAPDEGYCRCPHCERVHDNRVACPEYLAKSQSH